MRLRQLHARPAPTTHTAGCRPTIVASTPAPRSHTVSKLPPGSVRHTRYSRPPGGAVTPNSRASALRRATGITTSLQPAPESGATRWIRNADCTSTGMAAYGASAGGSSRAGSRTDRE